MKFVRIRGRIIPIKEKGESGKSYEKRLTKSDVKTGFAVGLTQSLFFKKKPVALATAAATLGHGIGTSAKRYQNNSFLKATWEDTKASYLKLGATFLGAAAGTSALVGLNKLNKLRKAGKTASSTANKLNKLIK